MTIKPWPRARRDLRKIEPVDQQRIAESLRALDKSEPNLDIKPLRGSPPWQRMRVGTYRIIFRSDGPNYVVARIVHRRELERAVSSLD